MTNDAQSFVEEKIRKQFESELSAAQERVRELEELCSNRYRQIEKSTARAESAEAELRVLNNLLWCSVTPAHLPSDIVFRPVIEDGKPAFRVLREGEYGAGLGGNFCEGPTLTAYAVYRRITLPASDAPSVDDDAEQISLASEPRMAATSESRSRSEADPQPVSVGVTGEQLPGGQNTTAVPSDSPRGEVSSSATLAGTSQDSPGAPPELPPHMKAMSEGTPSREWLSRMAEGEGKVEGGVAAGAAQQSWEPKYKAEQWMGTDWTLSSAEAAIESAFRSGAHPIQQENARLLEELAQAKRDRDDYWRWWNDLQTYRSKVEGQRNELKAERDRLAARVKELEEL